MSDLGRKDFSQQASETMKPDSQKSTMEQASEKASGAYDSVAGSAQPDSQKSSGQKAGDMFSSGSSDAQDQGQGYMKSAQDTLSGAAEGVSNALGGGNKK